MWRRRLGGGVSGGGGEGGGAPRICSVTITSLYPLNGAPSWSWTDGITYCATHKGLMANHSWSGGDVGGRGGGEGHVTDSVVNWEEEGKINSTWNGS